MKINNNNNNTMLIRKRPRRERNNLDVNKQLNRLISSIHDQTEGDPLSLGQVAVIKEHLHYALVVGFEANQSR